MIENRGSTWRKWDLHFHTPSSFDYEDSGVTNEEIVSKLIEEGVSVVAVTDHHVIDVDRILELNEIADGKVKFLPGIELRAELGGTDCVHFIGIFPLQEEKELRSLATKIRGKLNITPADIHKIGDESIYHDFQDTADLFHKLDGIVTIHGGSKSNSFEGVKINGKSFKKALKRDLAYEQIDIFEIGKPDDINDYEDIIFPSLKTKFPIIFGSDNHNINKYEFSYPTWIKADPTFEGLKQTLFEPENRVKIGSNPPPPPPKSIDKLSVNIEDDLYVKKTDGDEKEVFCLEGEVELVFSPNLNCLIGGRGTGKSTLLNLMRLKIEDKGTTLYPNSEVIDGEGDTISLEDSIEIDGTTSQEVEFLSQNQIEEFALNTLEFTKAIYDRLKQVGDRNDLNEKSTELSEFLFEVEESINQQNKKINRIKLRQKKQKEYRDKKKEIEILEDQKYSDLQKEIDKYSKELTQLRSSRNKLNKMLSSIYEIIQKYEVDPVENDDEKNEFEQLVDEGVNSLRDFYRDNLEKVKQKSDREKELEEELDSAEDELEQYLSELGYEEQNISNISSAQSQANQLELDIERIDKEISTLGNKVSSISFSGKKRKEFEDLLSPRINELNETLKKISEDTEEVEEISLKYNYDIERAFYHFCISFNKNELPGFDSGNSLSDKDVITLFRELLKDDSKLELKKDQEILEILENSRNEIKTNKVIFEYFIRNSKEKLKLLRLYSLLHGIDVEKYLKINVTYDGRNIESSSFGQRCTAAIVILLSLGSNPIIIDEPEAHLDSGLIAKYLVQLIKDRKRHRQIIFATHNANFVINGDAELIHVLDMNEQNSTKITSTTIENKEHRKALYNLEGGKEAFKQREMKYNFK